MKIKITKKSDNKNAWYNDCIGKEFEILTQIHTSKPVITSMGSRNGVICCKGGRGFIFNGDYEIVKEQEK